MANTKASQVMIKQFCVVIMLLAPFKAFCNQMTFDYQVHQQNSHIIHVVEFNPSHYETLLVEADNEFHKESLVNLAEKSKAKFAINAGFFKVNKNGEASPSGALSIEKKWLSGSSLPRAALGWNEKEAIIDNLVVQMKSNPPQLIPQRRPVSKWMQMTYVVSGAPLLVSNGKINTNFDQEKITYQDFIAEPHARTAIGLKPNGNWVIVVVEQRYELKENTLDVKLLKAYFQDADRLAKKRIRETLEMPVKGMTIPELADWMLKLGCEWALNLDGGASTGLYLEGAMKTRLLENSPFPAQFSREINTAIIVK